MAKLIWTDGAFSHLEEIRDYIAEHNPGAAIRTIEGIYSRTEVLREFPRLGYVDHDSEVGEVRVLVYGHYRISYLVDGESVVVTGVQHGARDRNTKED